MQAISAHSLAWRTAVALLFSATWSPNAIAQETPDRPAPGLRAQTPVLCQGDNDIVLADRWIDTAGDGVQVAGNCDIRIVRCHIVAGGAAVRGHGNGTITIEDSFLQGDDGAVILHGNADASYRGSTLRGAAVAQGNSELYDRGGNALEKIPGPIPGAALTPEAAVRCGDHARLALVNRWITAADHAVVVEGACDVLISDSLIDAAGVAIHVADDGHVRVRNTTVRGEAAFVIEDGGQLHAAGSNLIGNHRVDHAAAFIDGGGNAFPDRIPSALPARQHEAGPAPTPAESSAGGHGAIRIGSQGIEIKGADRASTDATIRINGGGVQVEGGHHPTGKVTSCASLCNRWPQLSIDARECTVAVLVGQGAPVLEQAACVDVRSTRACSACSSALALDDRQCRQIADRCLGH